MLVVLTQRPHGVTERESRSVRDFCLNSRHCGDLDAQTFNNLVIREVQCYFLINLIVILKVLLIGEFTDETV